MADSFKRWLQNFHDIVIGEKVNPPVEGSPPAPLSGFTLSGVPHEWYRDMYKAFHEMLPDDDFSRRAALALQEAEAAGRSTRGPLQDELHRHRWERSAKKFDEYLKRRQENDAAYQQMQEGTPQGRRF